MGEEIVHACALLSPTPPYQRTPTAHDLFSLKQKMSDNFCNALVPDINFITLGSSNNPTRDTRQERHQTDR